MTRAKDALSFGRTWRKRLGGDALASSVFSELLRRREEFIEPVLYRSRDESPVLRQAIAADASYAEWHVREHFRVMLQLPTARMAELGPDPMAFVRDHGVRRARMGVPLNAVLQGYRIGHKSFWSAISSFVERLSTDAPAALQASMLLSDYCIDYTDLISLAITEAYLAEEALISAQRTRSSIDVIESLLRGEAPIDSDARALCCHAHIVDGRSMVFLVARLTAGGDAFAARERSELARLIESALPAPEFGRLVDLRLNEIVGVVTAAKDVVDRSAHELKRLVAAKLAGGTQRIGIGLEVREIAKLPQSYAEAIAALAIPEAGSPIANLASVGVSTYLRHAADDTALRLTPAWARTLQDSGLLPTLQAFAIADLNVKTCAHMLGIHTNTVYHRLNNAKKLTGLDPRAYSGLTEMLTVAELAALQPHPSVEAVRK